MSEWISVEERLPETAGTYEWRVPSKALPGENIIVAAHMRERSAGLKRQLSPSFDWWDGWKLVLPERLEWRECQSGHETQEHSITVLEIEGVHLEACPFCKRRPQWKAVQRGGGGTVIGARPQSLNTFWLECCAWAKTPHTDDPRVMAVRRNAMLTA
jgi:hypothetical protein